MSSPILSYPRIILHAQNFGIIRNMLRKKITRSMCPFLNHFMHRSSPQKKFGHSYAKCRIIQLSARNLEH